MPIVMLWGVVGDAPFDAVRSALDASGTPHLVVDQARAPEIALETSAGARVEGRIEVGGTSVELDEVGAVYVRPHSSAAVLGRAGVRADGLELRHAALLDAALSSWTEVADALVLNRPSAMASNGSKPYQLAKIEELGFEVPATLVTTDPHEVRAFVERHGTVVYKSVSGVRSIVSRVAAATLARLDAVSACPTQFQAHVAGVDHRVHVVCDDLFACEIACDADDYRYASRSGAPRTMRAVELPPDVAARCHALAHALDLPLAGIDLRRTPQGAWVCFEVNPSPGFSWFEDATAQPIAAAIAAALGLAATGGRRDGTRRVV